MNVSGGLTVGAHHEVPHGWIPTEDGEDRAIVEGVVLLVQALGGGHVLAVTRRRFASLAARTSTGRPLALDAAATER